MKIIEVDDEVYEVLGNISIPFKETSPNMVLRRILGIDEKKRIKWQKERDKECREKIELIKQDPDSRQRLEKYIKDKIFQLNFESENVHSAFLTFLIDKYYNSRGNFSVSNTITFMELFNLRMPSGKFRNPWMREPIQGIKMVW